MISAFEFLFLSYSTAWMGLSSGILFSQLLIEPLIDSFVPDEIVRTWQLILAQKTIL